MNEFNGFPPGDLKFTSIPDLFFSRLLPQIDNLAELKIILHILWLRRRENKQTISLTELQADETLIHSLKTISDEPYKLLSEGLEAALADQILLQVEVENGQDKQRLYLLNSEGGRLMLEKIKNGQTGDPALSL